MSHCRPAAVSASWLGHCRSHFLIYRSSPRAAGIRHGAERRQRHAAAESPEIVSHGGSAIVQDPEEEKNPEMPLLAIYENTPLGSLPVDKIARSARILWFWPGQNVICHNYNRYLLNPMASPKRTMRALQILYSKSDSGSVEIFKFERVQFSSYAPMLNAMHFSTLLLSALALLCVYLLLTRKFSAPLGRNEPRKYSDNKDSGDGSAA